VTIQSHKVIGIVARKGRIWKVYTPQVEEIEQSLGEVRNIYDVCGCLWFCEDCYKAHNRDGCGQRYVYDQVRGPDGPPLIHFEDGRELYVDEIKAIILDNGKVVKMKMGASNK
jgi:hypothetical protein